MRSLVRTVCVWLLLLALPLQGVTAATMAHCGPARQAAVVMAHAGHDHAAMTAAAHEHEREHAGAVADPAGHPASHACSACAACCMALGLPASLPVLPSVEPERSSVLPDGAGAEPFVTGGLERPPRG